MTMNRGDACSQNLERPSKDFANIGPCVCTYVLLREGDQGEPELLVLPCLSWEIEGEGLYRLLPIPLSGGPISP